MFILEKTYVKVKWSVMNHVPLYADEKNSKQIFTFLKLSAWGFFKDCKFRNLDKNNKFIYKDNIVETYI